MKLTVSRSQNSETYYIQKSYRTDSGKSSTKTVERLGSIEELKARFGDEDPIGAARAYMKELSAAEKKSREDIVVKFKPSALIAKGEQRSYNGGYLFLQKIYYELGLDYICKRIEQKHRNKYDLNEILSTLVYARILYPGSKKSSFEDAKKFLEQPDVELHQVYRGLSLLASEFDGIQADVYKRSLKLGKRDTGVIYYDLTNYFFEWEEEGGLVQYGHCKEGRPLPIVQMGLFMDHDGIPLSMCIDPGNRAESTTLKPMEDKLRDKFGLSKLVICTDGGLSTYENRKRDDIGERAFVTVQSLKKLPEYLQEWSLETSGWRRVGIDKDGKEILSEEEYNLAEMDPEKCYDWLFCRERAVILGEKDKQLEQRMIVTFSFKYQGYLRTVRERQIARAQALVDKGDASVLKRKSPNDAKRYIEVNYSTKDGELATRHSTTLNREMIAQEERFDGFYAICTDLEDPAQDIIKLNSGRWQIENAFRIMKTDFKARPVYLKRDERIKAHFLTCFLALLLYKYLEKKVNRGGKHFTTEEIVDTLRSMDFLSISGEGYIPTYTRTDLTNNLHGSAGFRTDTQIVTKQRMRSIIAQTKKREKEEKE